MERDEGAAGGEPRAAEDVALEIYTSLERLRPHEHICFFYDGANEWCPVLIPYLRAGLERGHKCVWIYDRISPDEIRSRLGLDALTLEAHEASGRLVLRPSTEAYLAGGTFKPRAMVEFLGRLVDEAIAQGYPLIRYVGEANWAGYNGLRYVWQLLEYEATLNEEFFPYRPFSAVCLYDRHLFGADVLQGVMMTHPRVIWRNRLYSNPFYLPPERFIALARTSADLGALFEGLFTDSGERAVISEICADSPGSVSCGSNPLPPVE